MTTSKQKLPRDQAVRDRFLRALDRNAVVEAGAGTGKTTLVVDRIVALVQGRAESSEAPAFEPVPIERIAAVSFTDLSAAELGQRVRDGLTKARTKALAAGDTLTAHLLDTALLDLESAAISTIHGFSQRILREHALEAGLDPNFEVLGAVACKRLIEEVFELWFGEVAEEPAVRRALSFGFTLEQIEKLAREVMKLGAATGDAKLPELPQLEGPNGAIRALLRDAEAAVQLYGDSLADPGDLVGGRFFHLLIALRDLVQDHAGLLAGDTGDAAEWEAFELELMQPRWAAGFPGGGRPDGGKWVKVHGGKAADYNDQHVALRDAVLELRATIGARVAVELGQVLLSFRAHFEAEKQRSSQLDFDDLLVRAEELVREFPEVRLAVMGRYDTLFVDEFQDTDPTQARLMFFLAGDRDSVHETDWDAIVPAPGRLVLVGDPKQSIYRFRKADVETYRRCCELVTQADPEAAYSITTNFRTDGALVERVNRIFESGPAQMKAPADGLYQADYQGLVAQHAERGAESPVLALVQDESDAVPSADKNLIVEAEAVARFLKTHLGPDGIGLEGVSGGNRAKSDGVQADSSSKRADLFGKRSEPNDAESSGTDAASCETEPKFLGLGDVAILGRTKASLAAYTEALSGAGIDFVLEGGGVLFEEREVLEALSFLTAVIEPSRSTAVVGALRSVWFGLRDDELAAHKLAGGSWEPGDSSAGHPAVLAALERLAALSAEAATTEPRAFVSRVLGDPALAVLLRMRPRGAQAVMDLRRLASFLIGVLDEGGVGLASAVRFCDRLSRAGSDEAGAKIAAAGAVRLLTVHKAKGLEFGLVVLAQPSRQFGSGKDEPPRVDGGEVVLRLAAGFEHPRYGDLREADKLRAKAELLRLYYVALTRAKHFLLVPVFAAIRNGSANPKPVYERVKSGAFGAFLGPEFAGGDDFEETPGVVHLAAPRATAPPVAEDPEVKAAALAELVASLEAACDFDPAEQRYTALRARQSASRRAFGPSTVAETGEEHFASAEPTVGAGADARGAGEAEEVAVRGSGADETEAERARAEAARKIGTFVHRAIELRWTPELAAAQALEAGFEKDAATFIQACVATEAGLPSHARAFAEGVRTLDEPPVLWGGLEALGFPGAEHLLMNAFIDRLIQYEDGSVEVVDFKTDRIDADDEATLAEHTAHHMVQLGLYGLALEAAGLEVRQLTLAYLVPGKDVSNPFDEAARARSIAALQRFAAASVGA